MIEDKTAQTIEHSRLAYANTQDVIKFIDTKIGVIIGLITLTSAFPLIIFQWIAGRDQLLAFSMQDFSKRSCFACELFIGSCLAGTVLGGLGVYFAMQGIIARRPPQHSQSISDGIKNWWRSKIRIPKLSPPRTTFLFPLHDPENRRDVQSFFSILSEGLSRQQILDEYVFQLEQLV